MLGKLFGGRDKSVISSSFAEITQLAYNNIVLDSLNFDGTPGTLQTITVGIGDTTPSPAAVAAIFASWPNAPSAAALAPFISPPGAPTPPFGRIRPISPNLKNPRNSQRTALMAA